MTVQISVVHYAEENELVFNDVLVMFVKSIRQLTQYPYKLNIIDNQMHPLARRNLESKLPHVEIIRHEGKHHTFPAGANTAIEKMQGDYLVLLHTDLLVGWGWLNALVQDLKQSEAKYGVPCAISPLLLPYPKTSETPSEEQLGITTISDLIPPEDVKRYMINHHIPYKLWNNVPVAVSRPTLITDNGHQLGGAYMASRKFFEEVGPYDETLNRTNDRDYGIRALLTSCRNLMSNHVYLHHIGGLHSHSGVYNSHEYDGYAAFKSKWGLKAWQAMLTGMMWIKLHNNRPLIRKLHIMDKPAKSILTEVMNSPSNNEGVYSEYSCRLVAQPWKRFGTVLTGADTRNPDWHPGIIRDCCVLKLGDDWFMWFQASAGHGTWNIGLAKSKDGIHWKMHPQPVLNKGPLGSLDHLFLADPEVVYVNGKFHMFYEANDTFHFSCGYAESIDGIHWIKSSTPALKPSSHGYDTHDMSPLCILKVKGAWFLYYFARSGGCGPINTGVAVSRDLQTWQKPFNHPILTPNPKWPESAVINRVMWIQDRYVAWVGVRNVRTFGDGTALAWSMDGLKWHWGPLIVQQRKGFLYRNDIDVVRSYGDYFLFYSRSPTIDLLVLKG